MTAMFDSPVVRFLVFGGLAAAINWLARIVLSLALPFALSVCLAYAIGMVAGYLLYRRYVWRVDEPIGLRSVGVFIAVNLVGAVAVLGVSTGLLAVFGGLGLPAAPAQALAHGLGIAVGAVVNYLGHGLVTFRRGAPARPA